MVVAQRDVGAGGDQDLGAGQPAVTGRHHQRRRPVGRPRVDVRALPDQPAHQVLVRPGGRVMQRGPARLVDQRAALDQFARDVQVALDRGQHQRRLAGLVDGVDVGAGALEQRLDRLAGLLPDRHVQRRVALRVADVGIGARQQQLHDGGGVVVPRGDMEFGRRDGLRRRRHGRPGVTPLRPHRREQPRGQRQAAHRRECLECLECLERRQLRRHRPPAATRPARSPRHLRPPPAAGTAAACWPCIAPPDPRPARRGPPPPAWPHAARRPVG